MNFVYYSLHFIYTKLLGRDEHHFLQITAVMAIAQACLILSIIEFVLIARNQDPNHDTSMIVPLVLTFFLYAVNYRYYKKNEQRVVFKIRYYSPAIKILFGLVSLSFVAASFWLYLFDGLSIVVDLVYA